MASEDTCLVHIEAVVLDYFVTMIFCRRKSVVKAMSGGIKPATLRRKTFSGHGLELVVSLLLCVCGIILWGNWYSLTDFTSSTVH